VIELPNPDHGAEDPIPVNWMGLILEREQGPFSLSPTANFAGTERTNTMHLFENSIEVDATVFQCVKAWQECAKGWIANESFLDLETLNALFHRQQCHLSFKQRCLNWTCLTNSSGAKQALRWHYYGSAIHASGLLIFDSLSHKFSKKTKITLKLHFQDTLNGIDSLKLEMHAGLAMQNTLKQLKKIITSNISHVREVEPNHDYPQQNSGVSSPIIKEELIYATA